MTILQQIGMGIFMSSGLGYLLASAKNNTQRIVSFLTFLGLLLLIFG